MIHNLQIITDFGLLVLIWMVQLIVYPGFLYYKNDDLYQWHRIYTKRIAIIVAPLMLLQLAIAIFCLFFSYAIHNFIVFGVVMLIWIVTFTKAVPLHQKITDNRFTKTDLRKLIASNWIRTILWTFLFIYNFSRKILFS